MSLVVLTVRTHVRQIYQAQRINSKPPSPFIFLSLNLCSCHRDNKEFRGKHTRTLTTTNAKSRMPLQDGAIERPPAVSTVPPTSEPHAVPAIKLPQQLTGIEAAKQLAAWTAVDHHVQPEHKVIGIGSGSTVPYVVQRIVKQGKELNQDRVFIPTGFQSKELIVEAGLRLGDVDQYPNIDVTIDGADEVDGDLNCIKGGGACHLREKVLAEAASTWIVVADYRKNSKVLGTTYTQGIPIEVAPFAYAKLLQNLHHLGSPTAALRMAKASKAGPIVSDNGNFIIDAPFKVEKMSQPYELLKEIKMLTGVVEVGLFCGMAKAVYFGNADGSVTTRWSDGSVQEVPKSSHLDANS